MADIRKVCIPVSILRELLDYDSATGALYWKKRNHTHFTDGKHSAPHTAARWNSSYAGKPALTAIEPCGYLHGDILNQRYKAHRVAWALHFGEWPTGHIDHINGDPADNRIDNLRIVTPTENMRNQKLNSANTSGVVGVSWASHRSKWNAYIKVDRRKIHLGLFNSVAEAAAARKAAERKYGFHPNHGRIAA